MNEIDISYQVMYERCIYSSVAHAVYTFREPFFSFEQSWDNCNYSFYIGSVRGTITFDKTLNIFVGAAREEKSNRIRWYPKKQAIEFYKNAPHKVNEIAAKETLEYLYDDIDGILRPVITVSMWHDGKTLFISDDELNFSEHGGDLFLLLANKNIDLIEFWREQYSLTSDELLLIEELCENILHGVPIYASREKKNKLKKMIGATEGFESLAELGLNFF